MPHSRLLALAVALVPAVLTAAVWGCGSRPPAGVALVGATLIDGSGGPPVADAVILVRDGRIVAAGPRAATPLPDGVTEVDVRGRWIIPGLIDAHAHVRRWALPRYLAWGVTTVRDVHEALDSAMALRDEVNLGTTPGPRIYSAGAMIDGLPPTYPDAIGVNTPAEGRRAVDRLVRAGAQLVKIYTRVDGPTLAAVIDEARAFDLTVTAHLGLVDAVRAARAGVWAIEHMSGVPEAALADPRPLLAAHYRGFLPGWTAFERSWTELQPEAVTRVARELAARQVTVIPTLVLHETFSRLDDPVMLADTALRDVPPAEQRRWDVPDLIRRAGWTVADFSAFRRARPAQDDFLRVFAAAGGRVAAGTDAANQLLVPGLSVHRELELLVGAGLSPAEAILAGTRNGAALLDVDSVGVLAPGKLADLVVLTRDPLADIRNTRAVERVMLGGRLLTADSIRARW